MTLRQSRVRDFWDLVLEVTPWRKKSIFQFTGGSLQSGLKVMKMGSQIAWSAQISWAHPHWGGCRLGLTNMIIHRQESDIRSKCCLLTKYLGVKEIWMENYFAVKARRLYSAGGKNPQNLKLSVPKSSSSAEFMIVKPLSVQGLPWWLSW